MVVGGSLQIGFMVEKAPALAEAWDEAEAHPDELPPPAAMLLPQLSLSTIQVQVEDVSLAFKGTWLSAVYNMLVCVLLACACLCCCVVLYHDRGHDRGACVI